METLKVSKSIAGRRLKEDEVGLLLKEKRIGPLDDFISKAGKRFSAMLKLDEDFKVSFLFDNSDDQESEEVELLKEAPVVANCPVCESEVKQTGLSFVCVRNKKVSDGDCNFRITRKLLDKEIPSKNSRN